MKRLLTQFLVLWIGLFITLSCHANAILLVLGDSLSAAYQMPPEDGWVSLLENKLKKSYSDVTVINSSIVGDTTANGLARLPELLNKYHPTIVIIELGGNDGLRGLSSESIFNNLDKMIELSLAANAKVLLVGMRLPPNYGSNYTNQFFENYAALSKKHNIALVPFLLENIALKPGYMMPDRIHPNQKAQPLILENVWPLLTPLLPES